VKIVSTRALPLTSPEYAAELGRLRRWSDARWITYGSELAQIPTARWVTEHAGAAPVLRTSYFPGQVAAAAAGLGVMVASEPFRFVRRLAPIAISRALQPGWDALPVEELWLVGHRALRTVPRIAALWDFLAEHLASVERAAELAAPA
jgi:DNA-binding transcriptional LysR family regulator